MNSDGVIEAFFEEASELVADFESGLLHLEEAPADKELLNRIFRCAHTLKGNSAMLGFEKVAHFTHALEDMLDELRNRDLTVNSTVIDTLLASADVIKGLLAEMKGEASGDAAQQKKVLNAIRAILKKEGRPKVSASSQPMRQPEAEKAPVDNGESGSLGAAETQVGQAQPRRAKPVVVAEGGLAANGKQTTTASSDLSSIRVATEKLDKLMELVAKIVIGQSVVNKFIRNFTADKLHELQDAVSDMGRNTRELHERLVSIRMLPIGDVFSRFPRLVRDLANTFNKKVTLQILGAETELEKSLIERIRDPLTHLIRNAVDHGIDAPEERLQAGKPEDGMIRLKAFRQGDNLIIEVADDGRGLNTEAIRQRAIDQRLINANDNLTEEQIHMLILQPTISTASTITDVSGRGVGMDVVRKNVEALKGTISIQSQRGRGSTFRIKLPLTVAILDPYQCR